MAKAVSLINSAVDSGDPAATLSALQAPAASIRSVTEECATDYAESLTAAKSEKGGEEGEGWVEHRTREGNTFYYNWKTQQSQWEIPEGVPEKCSHLRREEIQVNITTTHTWITTVSFVCVPGCTVYTVFHFSEQI